MQAINVDLRQLRAFVAVARSLNFTRAAEELHIAQPSLSHTIQQLEKNVGFALFIRTTRTTQLTREGATFLGEATAVLDRYEAAMVRTAQIARGELGRLRVGYLIGAAVDYVPAISRAFNDAYPDVELDLIEFTFASPNAGLDTGETDVAIVRPPLNGLTGVISTILLHERCFVCLASNHRFAGRESVDVVELMGEPIIAAPGEGPWRDIWILNHLRTEPANVTYEAATFEAELRAVATSQSISIVPATAPRLYSRPGVAFVPINGLPDCDVAVVRRRGGPRTAVNFTKTARTVVKQASAS
ncbi:LysR family transcriptional regulator [Acidothermaceae bacterium B102]|nr:LysR family transcriptional regulator [Acidothermaceae bacterium B102]